MGKYMKMYKKLSQEVLKNASISATNFWSMLASFSLSFGSILHPELWKMRSQTHPENTSIFCYISGHLFNTFWLHLGPLKTSL